MPLKRPSMRRNRAPPWGGCPVGGRWKARITWKLTIGSHYKWVVPESPGANLSKIRFATEPLSATRWETKALSGPSLGFPLPFRPSPTDPAGASQILAAAANRSADGVSYSARLFAHRDQLVAVAAVHDYPEPRAREQAAQSTDPATHRVLGETYRRR